MRLAQFLDFRIEGLSMFVLLPLDRVSAFRALALRLLALDICDCSSIARALASASQIPPNNSRQTTFSIGEKGSFVSKRVVDNRKYMQADATQKNTKGFDIISQSVCRSMMNTIAAMVLIFVLQEGCMNSIRVSDHDPLIRRSNNLLNPGPLPLTTPMKAMIT